MKNTDITKIRQFLKQAKTGGQELCSANVGYPLYREKVPLKILKQALALLPCETCGDSGVIPKNQSPNTVMDIL